VKLAVNYLSVNLSSLGTWERIQQVLSLEKGYKYCLWRKDTTSTVSGERIQQVLSLEKGYNKYCLRRKDTSTVSGERIQQVVSQPTRRHTQKTAA
jgi:hypothetical protein